MALLISDPIFFHTIRKNTGSKRKLINITNTGGREIKVTISKIDKPEWLEFEDLYVSQEIEFQPQKKLSCIVNINTTHRKFP